MFAVYDNGKPAKFPECKVDKSWSNNEFETFDAAVEYANKWLGPYGGELLVLGKPNDYSGYGDVIEIREIVYLVSSDYGQAIWGIYSTRELAEENSRSDYCDIFEYELNRGILNENNLHSSN